jgi:hypothetical protein
MNPFHKFLLATVAVLGIVGLCAPISLGLGSYLDGQGALARAEAKGISKPDGPPPH